MHFRLLSLLAPIAACAALAVPCTAWAQDLSPPASEWRSYCQTYLKALDGDTTASDLDVTYCLGVTKGLLNGMRVGSQIGALSFASRVAVQYKLDPDEVFQLFQTQEPSRLLGICSPAASAAPDYVRAVLTHLEKNPDNLQRPIAEVFYEGLQASFPCD
jgi:hypothetical protein